MNITLILPEQESRVTGSICRVHRSVSDVFDIQTANRRAKLTSGSRGTTSDSLKSSLCRLKHRAARAVRDGQLSPALRHLTPCFRLIATPADAARHTGLLICGPHLLSALCGPTDVHPTARALELEITESESL